MATLTPCTLGKAELNSSMISARQIDLAVPKGTTAAQWQQLQRAMEYGKQLCVTIKITVIK